MDNVTHALIGVLLARAALPWVGSLRGALWAGIVASEAPDIDLVLSPFFEDTRLGYLVHHRGHTHTLVGAVVLALGAAAIARWRDPSARPGPLLALAFVGTFLHLGADAWNNYGVHPYWPFDDTWRYGDMIFILEPLLWLALLPVAVTIASRRVRIGLGVLALGLAAVTGFGLGPVVAAAWVLGTGALTLLQLRWDRLVVPGIVVTSILLGFGAGSRTAKTMLHARMEAARPEERVLDVVLTPRPATPWCWQGYVLSRDTTTYHARAVLLSLAPGLTAPDGCVLRAAEGHSAPLVPADLTSDANVTWGGRFSAPVAELGALAAEQCRVDAFLRFARAPFWIDDGARIVVGDLRFDFEAELGFADIETRRTDPPDTRGCGHLPPWRSAVVVDLVGG